MPPLELEHARSAQVLAEAALVASLYCAGLKLTAALDLATWRVPLRLTLITMPVTAALTAGAARVLLGLPIEEALVLGAVLAPTDAGLVSRLDLPEAEHPSSARLALTAEGALTSSLALPLVLLAIGFTGERDLGPLGSRWLALDVAWAVAGGVLLGALAGTLGARALARLDARGEAGWLVLLVAASVLASTYGAALVLEVNGLAAALAAGATFARGGIAWRGGFASTGSARAARLARRLAAGADRIARWVEMAAAVLIGVLFASSAERPALILFALLMLVAVRPLAARLGMGAAPIGEADRQTLAWFGVRGIASLYYLSLPLDDAAVANASELTAAVLAVLATSIALHGLTALPLGKRPAGVQGSR